MASECHHVPCPLSESRGGLLSPEARVFLRSSRPPRLPPSCPGLTSVLGTGLEMCVFPGQAVGTPPEAHPPRAEHAPNGKHGGAPRP